MSLPDEIILTGAVARASRRTARWASSRGMQMRLMRSKSPRDRARWRASRQSMAVWRESPLARDSLA